MRSASSFPISFKGIGRSFGVGETKRIFKNSLSSFFLEGLTYLPEKLKNCILSAMFPIGMSLGRFQYFFLLAGCLGSRFRNKYFHGLVFATVSGVSAVCSRQLHHVSISDVCPLCVVRADSRLFLFLFCFDLSESVVVDFFEQCFQLFW